jgi:hypothetical protein
MANGLDKKLDEVLEKLKYLGMVIHNLKDRKGTLITDIDKIDDRLLRELVNYEMLTEELKRDCLMLLVRDAESLARACVNNPNISDKISREFDRIMNLLDFIKDYENDDIKKSRELQDLAGKAKTRLEGIRKNMRDTISKSKSERDQYDKTQEMHRKLK